VNQKLEWLRPGKSKLRTAAEVKLAQVPLTIAPGRPPEELLHELQVHQIELEMQNEELRRAQLALEESRDRYLDLYEFAPVGYFTLTGKTLISEVNLTGATLLGEERKKLLQRGFARFITPADGDRFHRLIGSVLQHGGREACDLSLRRGDGSVIQAQLDCVRVAAGNEPPTVRLTLTDIAERKRAEAEMRVAASAFETQEGMLVTDAATSILRVNQAFTDITGFSAAEVVGQTPRMLLSDRHDPAFYTGMWKDVARTGEWRGEVWNLHKSGRVYPAWLTITAVKDEDGSVTHHVGTLIDITQRKSAEADIELLAFYDPMTRLPNRRLLLDRLQQALAARARSQRRGALLFIDLDDFKSLNDTLGHAAGDLLLQHVAQRLLACVRACDTVARLGGDEFVVMLGDLSANPREAASQAELVGEKILLALAPPFMLAGHEHHSTGCIGITLFSDHREEGEELLKRADLALYRAKAAGRSTLRFFDPEMQAAVTARIALEADLRSGMREGQFVLHYQRQVDREGRITGAEALVRWQHPRRGLVPPAEFIPLAEDTGLIQPLGQRVLEMVCAQLVAWSARPDTARLTLAMNVSAREFRRPELVSRVLDVIDRTGADPGRLMLEFTESLLVDDLEEAITRMKALRARGVGISLDDFGTGYSSLSYLKHLPLDQLKIDQSFVRDILVDSSDAAIARTIIDLGRSLSLAVIAEGVETEEQWNCLAGLGCQAFQGFLFGRPGSVEAMSAMVGAGSV
jgi:diguanylate cyclase (GGDEF)-like protein/PAS domain S-box-containing protein